MFTGALGYEAFVCGPVPMNVSIVEIGHADAGHSAEDQNRDDGAARVISETRQYLDLGATTLRGGTSALCAHTSDEAKNSVMGWFHPLLAGSAAYLPRHEASFHMP